MTPIRRALFLSLAIGLLCAPSRATAAAPPASASPSDPAPVYVALWFDTEDFVLPASDDAARRLAEFLSREGIPATFKVVGEKARVLERRGRADVIEALKRHAVGYHTNWHSAHPTPAERLRLADWDGGVREFARTERAGFEDVQRIFAQAPVCYGQPGDSWVPQAYAALRQWGVGLYLDVFDHVSLDHEPFWYGGLLNVSGNVVRTELEAEADVERAREQLEATRRVLQSRGGGVVNVYYHPCELVHRQFWDGVNFARGANPSPREWKLPPVKDPPAIEQAFRNFEAFVLAVKATPGVRFVSGRDLVALYPDESRDRDFARDEILDLARGVQAEISFVRREGYALSASEVFALLNRYVSGFLRDGALPGRTRVAFAYGPPRPAPEPRETPSVGWDQFASTCLDVQSALESNAQLPAEIWLGPVAIGPADYLATLAGVTEGLILTGKAPDTVTVRRGSFTADRYVADDDPRLWGWVIFPAGFHSPRIMELGKLQAWTLKPATPRRTP
jgi:hypothetical protein